VRCARGCEAGLGTPAAAAQTSMASAATPAANAQSADRPARPVADLVGVISSCIGRAVNRRGAPSPRSNQPRVVAKRLLEKRTQAGENRKVRPRP
jgi:hypothetical protein